MLSVDVVIQGAGIAGLALTQMLQKTGMTVITLDQRHALDTRGAGILLQDNAILALSHLGIDIHQIEHAATVSHINLGSVQHPDALRLATSGKARAMPRSGLLQELHRQINHSDLYWGTSIKRWQQRSDKTIELKLDDDRHVQCRWLIGADGVHSRLRQDIQGKTTVFRSTGQYCWRMLVDDVEHNNEAYEIHAGALRFGMIPTDSRQAYLYLVNADIDPGLAATKNWQDIKKALQHGGKLFLHLAEKINDFTRILFHPLIDAPVYMPVGSSTILIGDAAHPMTPNLGQGAAMALEDAVILGYLLQSKSNNPDKDFYNLRAKRVSLLAHSSFTAGVVAHWQASWMQRARTLGLRLTPTRILKYQQHRFTDGFNQQIIATKKYSL